MQIKMKGAVFVWLCSICWYVFVVSNVERVTACIRLESCPADMTDDGISCWKHTYGRGTGRAPYVIRCPSGLRDDGTSCWRDAHIYSKPCCCTLWGCCRGRCRIGYTDDGCTCRKTNVGIRLTYFERLKCRSTEDLYGTLCYPRCRHGYRAVGCCLCEPNGGPGIKVTLFKRLNFNLKYCIENALKHVSSRHIYAYISWKKGRPLQQNEKDFIKTFIGD